MIQDHDYDHAHENEDAEVSKVLLVSSRLKGLGQGLLKGGRVNDQDERVRLAVVSGCTFEESYFEDDFDGCGPHIGLLNDRGDDYGRGGRGACGRGWCWDG